MLLIRNAERRGPLGWHHGSDLSHSPADVINSTLDKSEVTKSDAQKGI
jgi:hypothetical protein